MSEYPSTPKPAPDGLLVTPVWTTVTTSFDAMTEQRKAKQVFAKYDVSLKYPEGMTNADIVTLWAFYMARKGAYQAFYIYDLLSQAHTGLYVGWGDGDTKTFDLPGKSTSGQKIYVDSVEKTVTTDYSIVVGGGAESSDRVTFVTAPELGKLITCDLTGYLRMRVRFKEDKFSRQSLTHLISAGGTIELKGLSPEDL
jgi:hypothetical protein